MKFYLKPTDPEKLDVDTLLLFSWEDDLSPFDKFDKEIFQLIKEAGVREQYEGKEGQFLILSTKGIISPYKLIIAGLGKKEDFDLFGLYKAVASAVKKAKETKPVKVALNIDEEWNKKFSVKEVVQSVVEAAYLSSYHFIKYRNEEEQKKIRQIEEFFLLLAPGKLTSAEEGLRFGEIFSQATVFARDLINEPSSVTTPSYLADVAYKIAKDSKGRVKVNVIEKDELKKLKMEAFLAVGKGSDEPPKFILLKFKPNQPKKKIVICGKGITFDTGGLSLKNAEQMETMKADMSGAAAVLAVFKALSKLHPNMEVIGLIPACENMPSGSALKPGDILRAMNGKTIEIVHTDAEGRLTLADAFSFAVLKEKPDEIVDISTLTGACMVALGEEIAGLWGNDDKLLERIEKSARRRGERIWHMPLPKDYKELIKSHIADMKNVQTGRFGGAVTAALFLSEFVGSTPWVHLDIAGPAFAEKDTPLVPKGGTGFGVRMLLELLTNSEF